MTLSCLVTLLVTTFVLFNSCGAADTEGPSSSTAADQSQAADTAPDRTLANFHTFLDAERIRSLPPSERPGDAYEIMWDRRPLFPLDTPFSTVEQGIRDWAAVGILDPNPDVKETRLIELLYNNGLWDDTFPAQEHVWRFYYEFDKDLHSLAKIHQNIENAFPNPEITDHLAHYNGRPLIEAGEGALAKMVFAYSRGYQEFYYPNNDGEYCLVGKNVPDLFRDANEEERRGIRKVMLDVAKARVRYGEELASLIYGGPTMVDTSQRDMRQVHTSLFDYPRFFSGQAPRQDMIEALQSHGKLRFYRPQNQGGGAWKVKLINPDAVENSPMRIKVTPLRRWERLIERINRVKLPV